MIQSKIRLLLTYSNGDSIAINSSDWMYSELRYKLTSIREDDILDN